MELLNELKKELQEEYQITRRFFEKYPDDKNDFKPHAKSMALQPLAMHIAEITGWPGFILNTSELDFAEPGPDRPKPQTREEMLQYLDDNYNKSMEVVNGITEAELAPSWTIKMNGKDIQSWSKYGAIRHALNQATHHRAQLGVYYRLNDIPLPGSYGPSADDSSF